MRSHFRWCTAGLVAVLAACPAAEDPVPDEGPPPCVVGSGGEGDGGVVAHVRFALKLCLRSPDAGAYVHSVDWLRLLDADGGRVLVRLECEGDGDSCSACGHRAVCDIFPGVMEVRQERTVLLVWNGRLRGPASQCPGTMQPCHEWLPIAPGLYTARFCFSRTLTDAGELGPLECTDRPVIYPFRNATAGTAMEL